MAGTIIGEKVIMYYGDDLFDDFEDSFGDYTMDRFTRSELNEREVTLGYENITDKEHAALCGPVITYSLNELKKK